MLFLFGILDILTALMFVLLYFFNFYFPFIFAIYLFVKGAIFFGIASIMDIFAAIFLVLAVFGYFYWIDWIFVIWLLQKGIFSLLRH